MSLRKHPNVGRFAVIDDEDDELDKLPLFQPSAKTGITQRSARPLFLTSMAIRRMTCALASLHVLQRTSPHFSHRNSMKSERRAPLMREPGRCERMGRGGTWQQRPRQIQKNRGCHSCATLEFRTCARNRLDVSAYQCVVVAARNRQNVRVHRSLLRPVDTRHMPKRNAPGEEKFGKKSWPAPGVANGERLTRCHHVPRELVVRVYPSPSP